MTIGVVQVQHAEPCAHSYMGLVADEAAMTAKYGNGEDYCYYEACSPEAVINDRLKTVGASVSRDENCGDDQYFIQYPGNVGNPLDDDGQKIGGLFPGAHYILPHGGLEGGCWDPDTYGGYVYIPAES